MGCGLLRYNGAMRVRSVVVPALVACLGLASAQAQPAGGAPAAAQPAPAAPPPVADFFRRPTLSTPVLSPSGRYVAATAPGGSKQRMLLVVIDLRDLARSKVLAAFADADVVDVRWLNDERLVFSVTDNQSAAAEQRGGSGLWAVGREDGHPLALIKRRFEFVTGATLIRDLELPPSYRLAAVPLDGSNDVIVEQAIWSNQGEFERTALWRLDTQTRRPRLLTGDAPPHVQQWALDEQARPRVAVAHDRGRSTLHWKATADAAWTTVRETRTFGGGGFPEPLFLSGDMLYVEGHAGNGDKTSLARVSLAAGPPGIAQALLSLDGFDFDGRLVLGPGGRLVGVHYRSDAVASTWFDPAMAAVQKRVDALLPATGNRLDCGACDKPEVVLVTAASDRQPPAYFLYRVGADALERIGQGRPWIAPAAMGQRDFHRIKARDGLELPMYVTMPPKAAAAAAPRPTVVLVHGGPYVRGASWEWSEDAQFLASRGYVVLEPQFRGSTGFGSRLFRAGWKQWGLAMQDDLADAARWAVAKGLADPGRICIAGASYGGYAVLMGLVRDPDLYRCGVQWVGVTDIELMYTIDWSDLGQMWRGYGMPVLVADRVADAEQIARTSPLRLAERIKRPVLMAYGGVDRRVPIEHGTRMRDALRRHGAPHEWIVYPDEGHGWMLEANAVDFWTRVEAFLAQHLSPPR